MRSTWIVLRRELPEQAIAARQGIAERLQRLGDAAIACILLVIASPLMLFVALAIRCESAGPVFAHRDSVSGSRRFQRLKFRTDIHDPYDALPPWARMPTPLGRFLWQTRIDALPQLLNVLRGDMRIIGQRSGSPPFLD
jgi:putative colanic acid biosysnthesis UDP-glucose lipid carrier transferase